MERADLATAVLTNPVFEDAFKSLEALYLDNMANTELEDVEGRNKWHACNKALKDVKTTFEAIIQNGHIEKSNEQQMEKLKNDGASNSE